MEMWREGVDWIYLSVVSDGWRAVVSMVMKVGHLSKCQLLERKSTPWIYTKRPCKNRCTTWRHTQQVPEHAGGRQEHTERLQQCLPVSKKGWFSDILQEPLRSPPIQDWDSATWGVLEAVLYWLRQIACMHRKPCFTHRDTNLGLLFDQFLAQPFGQGGDGMFCSTVHTVKWKRG